MLFLSFLIKMHALNCILLPRVLYVMCLATVELCVFGVWLRLYAFFIIKEEYL